MAMAMTMRILERAAELIPDFQLVKSVSQKLSRNRGRIRADTGLTYDIPFSEHGSIGG